MANKHSINFSTHVAAGLLCAGMISSVAQADEGSEPELLETMSMLQTMTHKSSLAIDHKNSGLLDFYAHELEEYIEKAESIESSDGKPIGQLVKGMLAPKFKAFKSAAEGSDWKSISSSFDSMIDSCNSCHQATGYNFINIKRTDKNPYMQSFESDN
ncbi:hypothetical protein IDSA_07895 [Pseudidiomarina salinarum]|uniref:Cytochrome C n=1 Tax=Pseudidiomarina salinarum TaxID=435908 RepID=A0A094L861_9GAMM|nr:hypothetical protein [Pseudidiomarina salinarum]KFZ30983.1 hypothetical protein IDSA_07895 [Pseudidiomarina salinarum]RUO71469.1 hypothetical protein CWI79_08585 [Pseudidiomarina salinarum]